MLENTGCGVFNFTVRRKQDYESQNMRLKGASL